MATVYVATDLRLERRVAIKIMHDHLAADDAFRTRFIHEARAAARLAHPNLVNVYDQGEDDGLAYLVMEYVPGITLRDLLHDHHRLTTEQTIDIMDAVLSGLQVAHRQGIIHRDIKPENVLLADDGRIKLSDFGLARAVTANTASGSVLLGTIAYLAPELVTQGSADVRSDVYSAGIMMYEMLVGEQPYRGDEPVNIAFRHANDNVPAPSDANPDVPQPLDDLVVWATERNPEDRPADAGAMVAALRQAERDIAAGSGSAIPMPVAEPSAEDPSTKLLAVADAGWDGLTTPTGEVPVSSSEPVSAAASAPVPAGVTRLEALNRQKRRSGVVAAIVVLLAVALAAGIGWWQGFGPGSYLAAPDVTGVTQPEAEAAVGAQGFSLGEVSTANSLEVPSGTIISMDPPGGTRLAPGSTISIVVSSGPEMLTAPSLAGLDRGQAVTSISEARFRYDEGSDGSEFSDTVAAGHVIRATTADGSALPQQMAEQSAIRLVVSLGEVPTVTGLSESGALDALDAAGLTGSVVDRTHSSTVPQGVVISQRDSADPMVPGSAVNLVVSLGPDLVEIPNVVGMKLEEAIATLQAAGFKVEHGVPAVFIPAATVSSMTPAAGQKVERGSSVKLSATYTF